MNVVGHLLSYLCSTLSLLFPSYPRTHHCPPLTTILTMPPHRRSAWVVHCSDPYSDLCFRASTSYKHYRQNVEQQPHS